MANLFRIQNSIILRVGICVFVCARSLYKYRKNAINIKLVKNNYIPNSSSCEKYTFVGNVICIYSERKMGLNKFVSMFTAATTDCNNNKITSTYNSELDIYGNSQRFKKSLLWSSLRRPKKIKGSIRNDINLSRAFNLFINFPVRCNCGIAKQANIGTLTSPSLNLIFVILMCLL